MKRRSRRFVSATRILFLLTTTMAILIRGEISVELNTRELPNLILLRQDPSSSPLPSHEKTTSGCGPPVALSDLAAAALIREAACDPSSPSPTTTNEAAGKNTTLIQEERGIFLVVSPDGNDVCHLERKVYQVPRCNTSTIRIFYPFEYGRLIPQLESTRHTWSFDAREEGDAILSSYWENREENPKNRQARIHRFQSKDPSQQRDLDLSVRIGPGGEVIVSERILDAPEARRLHSDYSIGKKAKPLRAGKFDHLFEPNNNSLQEDAATNVEKRGSIHPPSGLVTQSRSSSAYSIGKGRFIGSMLAPCSSANSECCSDQDCSNQQVCANRNCVDQGLPRFTLEWLGDDDLDLFVVTPGGTTISHANLYDPESGGKVGEPVEQTSFAFHVESIYFPLSEGGPKGTYEFYVQPLTTVGEPDLWTVKVIDEDGVVFQDSGVGFSPRYGYIRRDSIGSLPGSRPTPPSVPAPADCFRFTDECCSDSDCGGGGKICVNRNCIEDGNPRITLSWYGNDNLDLFVETPSGQEISYVNSFDPISGGRFGEVDQSGVGFFVENVYFPSDKAPSGDYRFFVRAPTIDGLLDVWTLTVVDNGRTMISKTGTGPSQPYVYDRPNQDPPTPAPQSPRPPPSPQTPTLPPPTCSLDSDCLTSRDVCQQQICIRDGNPRFTLSWDGDDDLDLFVVPPGGGTEVSSSLTFDPSSGAQFERDADQSQTGNHVENVYFPVLGTPIGEYLYGVRERTVRSSSDPWKLDIFDNGVLVRTTSGTGPSPPFQYDRQATSEGPQRPDPSPPRCNLIIDECCVDSDCQGNEQICVQRTCREDGSPSSIPAPKPSLPDTGRPPFGQPPFVSRGCPDECCSDVDCLDPEEICVQRTCILDGTPRFTLSWTGNDDLSLAVVTPQGTTISDLNPEDSFSGGIFGEDSDQPSFGFHVENIVFPTRGGPGGQYEYFVTSHRIRGTPDRWTLRVFVFGNLVASRKGTGDSRSFFYDFAAIGIPTLSPVTSPVSLAPIFTRPSVPFPTNVGPRPPTQVGGSCKSSLECSGSQVCIQQTCIREGNPRFTLIWSGNDDYDLIVETPNGNSITALSSFDPASGGTFDGSGEQFGFDRHVESIFFPRTGGPSGRYTYSVRSKRTQGSKDTWELSVVVGGVTQVANTAKGDSALFTFDFDDEIPTFECKADTQCRTSEVCVQEICIDSGNPRVTLTWTGDDDLDLYVVTPEGITISFANTFDPNSSGRFGEGGRQDFFGKNVENIYFPSTGPLGTYSYYVRNFRPRNENDIWTVEVVAYGQIIAREIGVGDSGTFTFRFEDGPMPTLPPAGFCNPQENECCSTSDCLGGEVCTQNTCIDDGTPRFTLTWTGDDDLDLFVITPFETVISFINDFDSTTGGSFGERGDQFEFSSHVENVFFNPDLAPPGVYTYYVRTFLPQNENDVWMLQVFVDGELVSSTTGSGDSQMLKFPYLVSAPTDAPIPPIPTVPPTAVPTFEFCVIEQEECCNESQCISGAETCVQFQCIDVGNPRFTLTWTGDDDLDIRVETPLGTLISFVNPTDEASGGIYGEEGSQFQFDRHVENIYFPIQGAPIGVYKFAVDSQMERNGDDRWTIEVFVDNKRVASESGFGDSPEFSFDFQGAVGIVPTPAPIVCSIEENECCTNDDCRLGQEICVQNACIDRGNPRFTLTWTGSDDLDLVVATPLGTTLSRATTVDEVSGGIFGETGIQLEFADHVENIFFPLSGGPQGTYTYQVNVVNQVGDPDQWEVTVYVDDLPVAFQTGREASGAFIYEFNGGFSLPPSPPTTPSPNAPTLAPINIPTVAPVLTPFCNSTQAECCTTEDCPSSNVCVQQTCLDEGNPRFTLTWDGDDDYDLTVTPPLGQTISFTNQVDQESGGIFGEEGVQILPGEQIESIFFPLTGGPLGTYEYEVTPFQIVGEAETWTVTVSLNGAVVSTETGSGPSDVLTYELLSLDDEGDDAGR